MTTSMHASDDFDLYLIADILRQRKCKNKNFYFDHLFLKWIVMLLIIFVQFYSWVMKCIMIQDMTKVWHIAV